jgi:hypothetical protein
MTKSGIRETQDGQLKRQICQGTTSLFYNKVEGGPSTHSDWFRGPAAKRGPTMEQMVPHTAVADFVTAGWEPEAPCIDKTTRITAFGSCFAANIARWLGERNYRVSTDDPDAQDTYVVSMGEGMVNSFVIRQQFEWAWEGRTFDDDLWRGYDKKVYGYDESIRQQTRDLFDNTDVFVLTFGLSEVWYDAVTNNVFWRTIPKQFYDEDRHLFRVSTVAENQENIEAIYKLIRTHRPDAKIIVTLSPVPLIATFRENSCITSNSVSKSVLRVALDEVMRAHKHEGHIHYWPSYEIITDVFRSPFKKDGRHIPKPVLDFVMTQFEHIWCTNEGGDLPSLLEAWVLARVAAGFLPAKIAHLVKLRKEEMLLDIIDRRQFNNISMPDLNRDIIRALIEEWRTEAEAA